MQKLQFEKEYEKEANSLDIILTNTLIPKQTLLKLFLAKCSDLRICVGR